MRHRPQGDDELVKFWYEDAAETGAPVFAGE